MPLQLELSNRPVVLVCGKTGAGKSSLIQAVTDKKTVPDSAIGESARPKTRGFTVYKTNAAVFVDAEGMEPGTTIEDYKSFLRTEIVRRLSSGKVANVITQVWYCIDGTGARIQTADKEIINMFSSKVLVIVTKAECMRKKQLDAMNMATRQVANETRIVMVSSETKAGLNSLIQKTHKRIFGSSPSGELKEFKREWELYYSSRQEAWLKKIDEDAEGYINWGAARSFGIAVATFLPLSDMIPLSINEAYMIMRIGSVYGESVGKNTISSLAGIATGSIVGKFFATLMPPGLKSIVAASVTYGLGKAAKAYFRSGKKLSEKELKKEFEKGKKSGESKQWEGKASCDDEE